MIDDITLSHDGYVSSPLPPPPHIDPTSSVPLSPFPDSKSKSTASGPSVQPLSGKNSPMNEGDLSERGTTQRRY